MSRFKPSSGDRIDPVLVSARREVWVILLAFVACLIWSVGVSYLAGYQPATDGPISTVFGVPGWVFWGVLVPWLAADAFAVWFCFFFMVDNSLETSDDQSATGDAATERDDANGDAEHA